MTAPRVLFVDHTGVLGGAELQLLEIVGHFRERCHVALFADGPFRGRLEVLDIPVSVLAAGAGMLRVARDGSRAQSLAAAPAVARMAWRLAGLARRFDVIYPNSQKAAVVSMLAGRLARRPVVWHLHDILSAAHFGRLQRRTIVTLANFGARRVIVNSQSARDAFVACGGAASRVVVIMNGLQSAMVDAASPAPAALREALGIAPGPLVGLFGRLTHWKGQHVLIEALALRPDVQAVVVGDAIFGERAYADELRRSAVALGVADRVHWLGFRDDVPTLMRMVDLVLHTSVSPEPFGRVIVEAMLARRPVLATDHGGAVELLGAGHPHLVKPADAKALAVAMDEALRRGSIGLADIIEANHARAVALFSVDRMLSDIDHEIAHVV
jgi:glycosyltransferase involved in cell wall biosynthesis